jgi:hypothetical protein
MEKENWAGPQRFGWKQKKPNAFSSGIRNEAKIQTRINSENEILIFDTNTNKM